jgi:hypothetical protein
MIMHKVETDVAPKEEEGWTKRQSRKEPQNRSQKYTEAQHGPVNVSQGEHRASTIL